MESNINLNVELQGEKNADYELTWKGLMIEEVRRQWDIF